MKLDAARLTAVPPAVIDRHAPVPLPSVTLRRCEDLLVTPVALRASFDAWHL